MNIFLALLVVCTVGCGGTVLETASTDATPADTSIAAVDTFVAEAAPVPPTLGDVAGTYLMGCLPTLAGGNPASQFLFRVDLAGSSAKVDFEARSFLETADRFSTDLLTGPTLQQKGIDATEMLPVRLHAALIPGNAQRISDNDLLFGELALDIVRRDGDTLCAEMNGTMTAPFTTSFDGPGDFCVLRRWPEGAPFPTSGAAGETFSGFPLDDFHCP